eukprot:15832826-Heterocapsa_arctica.AAC.1
MADQSMEAMPIARLWTLSLSGVLSNLPKSICVRNSTHRSTRWTRSHVTFMSMIAWTTTSQTDAIVGFGR